MKKNKTKNLFEEHQRKILFITLALFGALILSFVVTSISIGKDVKQKCLQAQKQYNITTCSEALIVHLEDSKNSLKERSQTVWALGQLGDKKALPVLKKHYDASECDHQNKLCRYELKKAIKLLEGGLNITAFIWRHSL